MTQFRFSVGPWNIHEGADTFGPEVRKTIALEEKIKIFKKIGFDGVQFHDDDAVPNINDLTDSEIISKAREVRKILDDNGLVAEFVAPRLWMDSRTIDGGFTSNDSKCREYAIWRCLRSVDIANELGCKNIVLWLAREGTYVAESKDPIRAIQNIVDGINTILDYDKEIRVLIEPKPNEPVDRSFIPTIGHVMGLSYKTNSPERVGGLLESAHAILAGLDPANEMAFALSFGKLWSVHLNDQNCLKYDQDKAFGVENLRQAFNEVKVLVDNNYGSNGEFIGLDVKAIRTQKDEACWIHLENSLKIFKMLEEKVRKMDRDYQRQLIEDRNYEQLEMYIMEILMKA